MVITQKIKIDLSTTASSARIEVAQEDKYSRDVEISLYAAGLAWQIPEGASALFRYEKSDGRGGSYNIMPDESAAFSISGNKITVKLAPQVCTIPGPVAAAVALTTGTTEVNTFAFTIHVRRTPGVNVVSEDYVNINGLLPASGWKPGLVMRTDENGNVVAKDNFRRIYVGVDLNLLEDSVTDLSGNYGESIKDILADVLQARSLQLWVSDSANGITTACVLLDDLYAENADGVDSTIITGLTGNPLNGTGAKFELRITEKAETVPTVILHYTANVGSSGGGSLPADFPVSVDENGYTQIEGLPRATNIDNVLDGDVLTVTSTLQDGRMIPGTMTFDANGMPESYTEEGLACKFSFTGFEKKVKTVELPVVELTTEPTVEGAALTEEESAVVKAAYATGLPAVVSFLTEGVRAGAVFVYGGDTGYVASIVGINFAISDDGNGGYVFTGGV